MQELLQDFERRTKRTTRQGQRFNKYRLTVPTDLTQQTLRTMRPKHSMREDLVENCQFGRPVIQGEATFQLWTEARQEHTRRLVRQGTEKWTQVPYNLLDGHFLPQSDVSVVEVEAASRGPRAITKLSHRLIGLLQSYGTNKVDEWIRREIERKAAKEATTDDSTPLAVNPVEVMSEGSERTGGNVGGAPAEGSETQEAQEPPTAMETVEEPSLDQEETQIVGLTVEEHKAMTLGDAPVEVTLTNLPASMTLTDLPAPMTLTNLPAPMTLTNLPAE